MAHRVFTRSRDFYKFCLIAFLVFNNGFPIKGLRVPREDRSDGSKSPTVKQCRAHIEAALDQYWEASEEDNKGTEATPDNRPTSTQPREPLEKEIERPQSEDETDQDDDDTDPPVDAQTQDETQEGEDDDDDDDDNDDDDDDDDEEGEEDEDDDDDNEDDTDEQKETTGGELDTGNEDDENETAPEETNRSTETDNGQDAEDDEDDEEDKDDDEEEDDEDEEDDDDDEEQEEKAGALKEEEHEEDEDEDNEQADEEGEDEDDEEADEEGEDEDDEGEEDENTEDDTKNESSEDIAQTEESNKTDTEDKAEDVSGEQVSKDEEEEKEEEEDDDDDEADDEDEEKVAEEEEDEDEEDEEKVAEEEDDEDEEDEDEEEDLVAEAESEKSTEGVDTESASLQKDAARGDKVTGETHSAPVGMAPELSESEPTSDKPKASPVEEKATLETPSQEIEDEEEEEDEDEGDEETDEEPDEDEDLIENIYEEEDEEDIVVKPGETLRSRDHVDAILGLDDIGTNYDVEEEKLAQSVFKEIKKIQSTSIRPMEMLYKYSDSTTRLLGDAEIFSKPMVLFLGPWSSGKTTVINYLLGLERTPAALKTGTGITDMDFTVLNYGEERRITSGTALAAEWTYAGVQKFGQGFLDHFKGITIPHTLLKKITVVDTPGIIESKKINERTYPFNDAFQWFIDRADAIYVVLDPTKVDIGAELGSVLDQLKGREARFILNKADTIRRSDLMRVVGQLFWNLSPLMSSAEAPVIYAVSLSTKPFHPSAPAKFLADQENNFLYDLRDTIDKHVENRIRFARRHAVRVRNHCKMVDCYLSTYYRNKSIFSSKKNVAKLITENPTEYSIYEGLSSMTNVSRYDLPDPVAYKSFFRMHPLYDFKPLVSTCSYFRGCPMDKLDLAISSELPELLAKYKKAKLTIPTSVKQEGR